MKKIDLEEVTEYVERNIQSFHAARLNALEKTNLKDLLRRKNPYLFKAKNIETAQDLIESLLDANLSSSEEEMIGTFLEGLAIFVANKTLGAHKSAATGIDFEYDQDGTHILFAMKSGENWGNSSQWAALVNNVKNSLKVMSQSQHGKDAKFYLGVSYGRKKQTLRKGIIHQVCGQEFWQMISGQKDFYKDIVKPIGYRAKEHNQAFSDKKARLINRLTRELANEFCDKDGNILWSKLVEFNSGNLSRDDQETLTRQQN